jgi:diguanylate cyclase (GGDEF)-like protein
MDAVDNLRESLCSLEDLPALPAVAVQILEKIKDPETPMRQLAEILAMDPPLSAKVLAVVNSSFFGLPRKITNLPHAVNLLGEESLKYIALSFSLINLFDRSRGSFDYTLFWKHSLTSALVSRLIAEAMASPDAEDMYFLGLIHNIGILVLLQSHPRQYRLVIDQLEQDGAEFHAAETAVFGFNHMQVGAFLLEQWGLPQTFSRPVLYHHCPEGVDPDDPKTLARARTLRLASEISRFMHEPEKVVRLALIEQILADEGLSGQIELHPILEKASMQLEPLLPLFDIQENSAVDYVQLLEESKKEMFNLSFNLTRKIKSQQEAIDTLSTMASQDGLTQLKNYQSFQKSLDREIESIRRYGHASVLAMADLDAFKSINDRHGHLAGDYVLQAVSRLFLENIRKSDIVARYGGEEFVFILSRTGGEDGFAIMDRLRRKLAGMDLQYREKPISLTMSVGLTEISGKAPGSKNELLRQADTAMYQAKNLGRNRTVRFGADAE